MDTAGSSIVDDRQPLKAAAGGRTKVNSASARMSLAAGYGPAARADVSCLLSHIPGRKWVNEIPRVRAVSTKSGSVLFVWCGFSFGQPGCGWLPGPTERRVVGARLQPLRGSFCHPVSMNSIAVLRLR
ncbi:hypothetical protein J7T55_010587 [Diaporthe amygdali]|uniref:uncharacterized protein n=1 Tax=Phomopsis amygdali TaxID=1214568 RepID=UPI0022FDE208|nr:uncharacterized protein J7T55_010587 [Diaporthe amygdali]KAJ0115764.1 hypothetical protein J7T55_010587 [Diaporthe amygdali]